MLREDAFERRPLSRPASEVAGVPDVTDVAVLCRAEVTAVEVGDGWTLRERRVRGGMAEEGNARGLGTVELATRRQGLCN